MDQGTAPRSPDAWGEWRPAGSVVLAGTRHSPSKLSDQPLELFEIYSPAGGRFGFVVDEG